MSAKKSRNTQQPRNTLIIIVAILLAAGLVFLVKWLLVPSVTETQDHLNWIVGLEVIVVLAVLGAFFLNEIIEAMERMLRQFHPRSARREHEHGVSSWSLINSLAASVIIYLAALYWIKVVITQ